MVHSNLAAQHADRAWMLQLLMWKVPATCAIGLLVLGLFMATAQMTFLVCGSFALVYGLLLLWSRRLALRGRLGAAAGLAAGGLAVTALCVAIQLPSFWPMAVLLHVAAAVLLLPYVRPSLSRVAVVGIWAFGMLPAAIIGRLSTASDHASLPSITETAAMGGALGLVLLMLWQYHARHAAWVGQVRPAGGGGDAGTPQAAERDERDFAVTLTQTMGQGLSVTDAEGRYEYVNPALARMTGYALDDLIGRPVMDITPPDERDRLRRVFAQRSSGIASSYEMRIRRADGSELYALISGVPRFRDGRLAGNIAVITDLTERRRMEQAVQDERDFAVSVMNAVGQGLLVTDVDGCYAFVNQAMAHMLGYEREQLAGKRAYDFTFPEDRERLTASLNERRVGISGSYEIRMRHADGSAVYGLVSGTPRMREGQFAGTIVAVTDLTERKRIEAAVAFARDEAVAASRLKSEFLANMSHELRTPLSGVIGMADLLSLSELTADQRSCLEVIRTCGKTLLELISEILDLSRIEAGKLDLRHEPFDPRACVRAAAAMVGYLAEQKGLALQVEVDETVPAALVGDAQRVQQVLTNLLGNAVKFTHQGSVLLCLSGRTEPGEHLCTLTFLVQDTGIGISRDHLGVIFEPFVQVDASTTRRYGGTGLGLAICRRLVELMNGTISVESEVGSGSRFSFTCRCSLADGPHQQP